jgi:hypothetical protein
MFTIIILFLMLSESYQYEDPLLFRENSIILPLCGNEGRIIRKYDEHTTLEIRSLNHLFFELTYDCAPQSILIAPLIIRDTWIYEEENWYYSKNSSSTVIVPPYIRPLWNHDKNAFFLVIKNLSDNINIIQIIRSIK